MASVEVNAFCDEFMSLVGKDDKETGSLRIAYVFSHLLFFKQHGKEIKKELERRKAEGLLIPIE